jgi:hypothetical protein
MRRIARSRWVACGALAVTAGLLAGCNLGEPPTTYPSPTNPSGDAVGLGDVNGDADLDIVTVGNDTHFGALLSDGNGGYTPATYLHEDYCKDSIPAATCDSFRVAAVKDFTSDGRADVVISYRRTVNGTASTELRTRGSLGDGFTASSPVATYPAPSAPEVYFADVTGEGILDMVVVDVTTAIAFPNIDVYQGTGLGGFGDAVSTPRVGRHRVGEVHLAYLNDDRYADLVVTGTCAYSGETGEAHLQGCVHVNLANRAGGFWGATAFSAADLAVDGIPDSALADFDEDGDLDLIGANSASDQDGGTSGQGPKMSVFRGDGAGDFGWEESRPELAAGMTGAVAGDFDVDGVVDLLVATDPAGGAAGEPIVFGDGTGQFTGSHALTRTSAQPGLVGDLDGDGKPDYVQNTTDGIRVFMNRWDGRPG